MPKNPHKPFKLTVEEANVLDKLAESTKMDGWFCIDGDLHVIDLEDGNKPMGDAEGVMTLDDGLAYSLEHEGLTEQEAEIYVDCINRARESLGYAPKGVILIQEEGEYCVACHDKEKLAFAGRESYGLPMLDLVSELYSSVKTLRRVGAEAGEYWEMILLAATCGQLQIQRAGTPPKREFKRPTPDDAGNGPEGLLWDCLLMHLGHRVEIAAYGDPSCPQSITLEDLDTNEVILDAGIYDLVAKADL